MARRLPPLRALETFEAICRHGGVARAAEELGVSPGAVSQQLRLLEDHVGRALFRRTGRRLELTAAGKPYFEMVFEGFERLRDAQKLLDREIAGLAISALPSLMLKWLAPRVYGSRVVLHHRSAELFVDRVVPMASPTLVRGPLSQSPLAPADIARLPLVHVDWRPDHQNGPTWDDWFAAAGVDARRPPPERLYSLSSVALEAATRGEGVALAQRSFAADDLASGRLTVLSDLELPMPVPYFVAWTDATIRKPGARDFLDWLLGEAAKFR